MRKKFNLKGRKLTKSGAQKRRAKSGQKTIFETGEKQRIKLNIFLPI
jgi:hypothetical protein